MILFTGYPLTTNTKVNLPPVLIMCELLIQSKAKNEAWDMKQFTSYPLTTNTLSYSSAINNKYSLLFFCMLDQNSWQIGPPSCLIFHNVLFLTPFFSFNQLVHKPLFAHACSISLLICRLVSSPFFLPSNLLLLPFLIQLSSTPGADPGKCNEGC